jgi:hypothetical protein
MKEINDYNHTNTLTQTHTQTHSLVVYYSRTNVLKYSFLSNAAAISGVVTTAPIGYPFAIAKYQQLFIQFPSI